MLDEAQKRRYALLKEAKSRQMPAVHPRFWGTCESLYKEPADLSKPGGGTFLVRTVLCLLLFALFVLAEDKNVSVFNVSGPEVVRQIESEPAAVSAFFDQLETAGFLDK